MSRLRRSCLTVPGSNARMLAKAREIAADEIIVDLEDAVPASEKTDATRERVVQALRVDGWAARTRAVRVNAVSSGWCLDDLTYVVTRAGAALDAVVIPKVERASELHFVSHLLDHLEDAARSVGIAIEAQIESPRGLAAVDAIATATGRLEALVFGPGDFAAALGTSGLRIGVAAADYPGDEWHYVRSRIATTASAFGLQAIDGPYATLDDEEGLLVSARAAAVLGFDGKWAVHPAQIDACNAAFTPSSAEYKAARALLDAHAEAVGAGTAASRYDGGMIDEASRRMAEDIVVRGRAAGLDTT